MQAPVFGALLERQVAKRYARKLGPYLREGWGASEHYTPAQIRSAVSRTKLPQKYICFGYAVFLPEDAFDALVNEMPAPIPYLRAEKMVGRYTRWQPSSASSNPESTYGVVGINPDNPP